MSQKGGIALILLILIVVAGLAVGVYFISQNTGFFSKAGSAQITIPYPSPSLMPNTSPAALNQNSATSSAVYENPFEAQTSYENPFEESYENPFNNL